MGSLSAAAVLQLSVRLQGIEESFGGRNQSLIVRWTADGRGFYVVASRTMPVTVYRLDLATGRRERIRSLAPADSAGVLNVFPVLVSADGKSYVYSYRRILDDLYIVTGAR